MPYEAARFPISGKQSYYGLIVAYVLLAVYAVLATVFGAATVGDAAGHTYALMFPFGLLAFALGSLFGVVRSRYTANVTVEYVCTVGLIAGLWGYAGAIAFGAFVLDGSYSRVPAIVLPLALSVQPATRAINILIGLRLKARAAKARRESGAA